MPEIRLSLAGLNIFGKTGEEIQAAVSAVSLPVSEDYSVRWNSILCQYQVVAETKEAAEAGRVAVYQAVEAVYPGTIERVYGLWDVRRSEVRGVLKKNIPDNDE